MPFGSNMKRSRSSRSSSSGGHGRPILVPIVMPQDWNRLFDKSRESSRSPTPLKEVRGFSAFSSAATASGSDTADSAVSLDRSAVSHYTAPYRDPFQRHPLNPWSSQILSVLDTSFSRLVWDVRRNPSGSVTMPHLTAMLIPPDALLDPLTSAGSDQVRIISKDFPWTIDIGPKKHAITGSETLTKIFEFLQEPLDDAVWGCATNPQREIVQKAWKRREDPILKNVDWLGKNVMFKGFYRDPEFAKERLHPSVQEVPETWVVTFGRH